MSNDEPTFTYDASKPLTEEQKRALAEAQRNPPPITMLDGATPIRNRDDLQRALASEAKAHQWEHMPYPSIQPVALKMRSDPAGFAVLKTQPRTFTREEVLTVLRTCKALDTSVAEAIRIFERME